MQSWKSFLIIGLYCMMLKKLRLQVVDINEEGNEETAQMVREFGVQAYAYKCDVSKKENIKR